MTVGPVQGDAGVRVEHRRPHQREVAGTCEVLLRRTPSKTIQMRLAGAKLERRSRPGAETKKDSFVLVQGDATGCAAHR